ncbi:MAG: hypothetical protein JWN37_222 [Candidatus Nomurabacteria bacterium]|nr:hypothetical protein [Candidatus Nomurabacteria bacterium]
MEQPGKREREKGENAFWLDENPQEPAPALIYEYQTLLRKMHGLYAKIKEGDLSGQEEWVKDAARRKELEEEIRASGGDPKDHQITIH